MFWKKFASTRKQKVDERTHVNPTISVLFKEQIERLAFILGQPVGITVELLFQEGIDEREIVERIAPYFRYGSLIFFNTLFMSHEDNKPLQINVLQPSERISVRFDKVGHSNIEVYADLLDVPKSQAVAVVIGYAIRHPGVIEYLLQHYNYRMGFDEIVIDEMKKLMKFMEQRRPKPRFQAQWNKKLILIIEGPKKKPKNLLKPMTEKCIDTETYRWNFD